MLGKRPFLSIIAFFSAFILRHETPNVPSKSAKTQMLATVLFFLDCFGAVEKQQSTPAVGNLCWVCSGISKLAEEQGPPLRADVMNSSRECFTFLFLAVVRSFPENQGKKHSGIIFWSIWEQRVEGAKELRLKTHAVFFYFIEYLWLQHLAFPFSDWYEEIEQGLQHNQFTCLQLHFYISFKNTSSYTL